MPEWFYEQDWPVKIVVFLVIAGVFRLKKKIDEGQEVEKKHGRIFYHSDELKLQRDLVELDKIAYQAQIEHSRAEIEALKAERREEKRQALRDFKANLPIRKLALVVVMIGAFSLLLGLLSSNSYEVGEFISGVLESPIKLFFLVATVVLLIIAPALVRRVYRVE